MPEYGPYLCVWDILAPCTRHCVVCTVNKDSQLAASQLAGSQGRRIQEQLPVGSIPVYSTGSGMHDTALAQSEES